MRERKKNENEKKRETENGIKGVRQTNGNQGERKREKYRTRK